LWRDKLTEPEESKNVQKQSQKLEGNACTAKEQRSISFKKLYGNKLTHTEDCKRSRRVQGSGEQVYKNLGLPFCVCLKKMEQTG